ncbi:MAG: hypothetical protein KDB61_03405, partial [Planctomycetes bacterium]|nr:hypothetical protein [Planctomycetota bacterium]
MAQTVWLVDDNSPATAPTGQGSWSNAFQDPQDAFDGAVTGDTILIAEGSYSPDPAGTTNIVGIDTPSGTTITGRHHSFVVKVPVTVIGGFVGYTPSGTSSTNPLLPDGLVSKTILHGDFLNTPADPFDNSHHVVHVDGSLSSQFSIRTVELQRMIIRDGNTYLSQASSSYEPVRLGAGIH